MISLSCIITSWVLLFFIEFFDCAGRHSIVSVGKFFVPGIELLSIFFFQSEYLRQQESHEERQKPYGSSLSLSRNFGSVNKIKEVVAYLSKCWSLFCCIRYQRQQRLQERNSLIFFVKPPTSLVLVGKPA